MVRGCNPRRLVPSQRHVIELEARQRPQESVCLILLFDWGSAPEQHVCVRGAEVVEPLTQRSAQLMINLGSDVISGWILPRVLSTNTKWEVAMQRVKPGTSVFCGPLGEIGTDDWRGFIIGGR